MLKQPMTKKLSEKNIKAAVDRDGNPVSKLFDDEQFYQIPKYPRIFISQYARIIETYKKAAPKLLSPSYDTRTGYTTIVLTSGHGKRKCWGIHALVALVWLKNLDYEPDCFGKEDLDWWKRIEIHHLKKVKANLKVQPIDINWAENLRYIYRKYHKTVDAIKKLKYRKKDGGWRSAAYVDEIAAYCEISEKDILELLMKKPAETLDGWDYYISGDVIIGMKRYKK